MRLRFAMACAALLAAFGCSHSNPMRPLASGPASLRATATSTATLAASSNGRTGTGQPGYEPAYEDGRVVTINAILVPGKAPATAQADLYLVVYPPDWPALGIAPPQCNPCDHFGDGVDPGDFHDHVLDSAPGDAEFRAPWHVFVLAPAYNGDAQHDAAIGAIYQANLPLKSEADVLAMSQRKLDSGEPVATLADANFYFVCSVVGQGTTR